MPGVRFWHRSGLPQGDRSSGKLTMGYDGPAHLVGGRMRTHRFGRKLKLPSTIAIKHQIRCLMAEDEINKADARAETTDICRPSVGRRTSGKRRFSFGPSLSDGASVIGSSLRPYLGSSQSF